jgi:transcription initiation factor TFIIIB Brf1 subunit/transcription initiation factor TFIIB
MDFEELLDTLHKSKSQHKNEDTPKSEIIKCNECNSTDLIENEGYSVCRSCGMRNECVLDLGQEWHTYSGDDGNKSKYPARCGMPTNELLPNSSMGVIIAAKGKETYEMKKARNLQYWSHLSYQEANLIKIFNNITIISQNSGISSCIIEEAKIMYMKVCAIKTSRRLKKDCMKAASVSLACKLLNVPRSCEEICTMFSISNKKLFRKALKLFEEIWFSIEVREKNEHQEKIKSYLNSHPQSSDISIIEWKQIREEMDKLINPDETDLIENISITTNINNSNSISSYNSLETHKPETIEQPISLLENIKIQSIEIEEELIIKEIINPHSISKTKSKIETNKTGYNSNNYLHRICCKLNLEDKSYTMAQEICDMIDKNKILEKHNPVSRISTVVYLVSLISNLQINKHQISLACNVSEVTINKCYKKLNKFLSLKFKLTEKNTMEIINKFGEQEKLSSHTIISITNSFN